MRPRFFGFSFGFPFGGFSFYPRRPFPDQRDYLRMLEKYKRDLEEELKEVEEEIQELKAQKV